MNILLAKALQPEHVPSFYIFQKNGARDPDILQAFLVKRNLTVEDVIKGSVTLEGQEGKVWRLCCDQTTLAAFKKRAEVFCLISFQQKKQGFFAVAKVHRIKQQPTNIISKQENI